MNIILHHLDALLNFHSEYDQHYRVKLFEKDEMPSFFQEAEEKNEEHRKIYRQEMIKVYMKITDGKTEWGYITQLYKYLMEEEFIEDKKNHYSITLKGKIFEGYVNKANRFDREKNEAQKRDNQLLFVQVLLALGTIGLLLWEIWKWYFEKYSHYDIFFY